MKKLLPFLIFSCFILSSLCSKAQQRSFAPIGAEWYYSSMYGVYHSYALHDTVVQGQASKIIQEDELEAAIWAQQGYPFHFTRKYIMYGNEDSVFIFNKLFNRFTPLYVFNVQPGDTVGLPVIPVDGAYITDYGLDSSFYFVVDSVKLMLYDTAHLKTVYSHSIRYNNSPLLQWGWGGENVYAEQIGSLTGNLPICGGGCSVILAAIYPGNLRCYHDSAYAIRRVPDSCDDRLRVGVAASPILSKGVNIYPNPARDVFTINNTSAERISTAALYAPDGRLLYTIQAPLNKSMSVAHLPEGLYLLQLTYENRQTVQQKLLVQH